jgi:hypothetical protein
LIDNVKKGFCPPAAEPLTSKSKKRRNRGELDEVS